MTYKWSFMYVVVRSCLHSILHLLRISLKRIAILILILIRQKVNRMIRLLHLILMIRIDQGSRHERRKRRHASIKVMMITSLSLESKFLSSLLPYQVWVHKCIKRRTKVQQGSVSIVMIKRIWRTNVLSLINGARVLITNTHQCELYKPKKSTDSWQYAPYSQLHTYY